MEVTTHSFVVRSALDRAMEVVACHVEGRPCTCSHRMEDVVVADMCADDLSAAAAARAGVCPGEAWSEVCVVAA